MPPLVKRPESEIDCGACGGKIGEKNHQLSCENCSGDLCEQCDTTNGCPHCGYNPNE